MKRAAESKKQSIGKQLIRSRSLHSLIIHLGSILDRGFVERLILRLPALETFNQQVFVSGDTATDQLFRSMARAHGAGDRASAIGIQRSDDPVG